MKKRAIILRISSLVIGIAVAILLFPPTSITMWSQNVGAQEQQRVIEIEIDPNVAKAAIEAANRYTGLNELQDVRIAAEKVIIKEDEDDSPIAAIHSRIVGRPLIRVTYTASLPEWRDRKNNPRINPYIQAFDVFLDAKDLSLLKIASRWADNIDLKYKLGARISRKQIASIIRVNQMASDALPNELPKIRVIDILRKGAGAHIDVKHIECFYILHPAPAKGKSTPAWFLVTHGGPIIVRSSPPGRRGSENLIIKPPPRTATIGVADALTGASLGSSELGGMYEEDLHLLR